MSTTTWIRPLIRRTAALALAATAVAVIPAVTQTAQAAPADCLCAGGEYYPLTPSRVYDTLTDVAGGVVDGSADIPVKVLGVKGVPDANVLAVAINVTIAGAPSAGYASVRPSDFVVGASEPTSLVNFQYPGHTVPNFTIVGVGADGNIIVDLTSYKPGNARVIVDVFGFIATSSYIGTPTSPEVDGARLVPVTPKRILDTRAIAAPLGPKQSRQVPIRGVAPVPASANVSAVVVNLTGINTTNRETTYMTLSPDQVSPDLAEAPSSNGNYQPGVIKANLAIVPLNADGSIWVYNRSGSIDVAIDVVGYLEKGGADDTTTGRIIPLEAPFRAFDTRKSEFGSARLGYSQWEDWSFQDFAQSVKLNGVAAGTQTALFGNLTIDQLQRNSTRLNDPITSYMTMNPAYQTGAYPATEAPNSNLNFDERGAVANSAIVTYGSKAPVSGGPVDPYMVSAFNRNGSTHYILDAYAIILA